MDLDAAGIPIETNEGTIDFHGLRHTYCTRLARSGISPKEAQTLARHSSITLTMDRYAHLQRMDSKSAMYWLPNLPESSPAHAATGTDGRSEGARKGALIGERSCDSMRSNETSNCMEAETPNAQLSGEKRGKTAENKPLDSSSGGGTRTPDTRIMIPLL